MNEAHAERSYAGYWIAWLVLLGMTLTMVTVATPAVLVAGVVAKASIIALWFMHLRYERLGLGLCVAVGILATLGVLFGLIVLDARGV